MRFLITGATGKVGNAVARRLADRGDEVVALVRNPAKARELLPPGVELARGDVTDPRLGPRGGRGRRGGLQLHGAVRAMVRRPGHLRAGERRGRAQRGRGRPRSRRQARWSTPPPSTSSTPRRAAPCRRTPSPTTRRAPPTSARSSAPRSWCSIEAKQRDRAGDRQPVERLWPRPVAGNGARPGDPRRDSPPPACRSAGGNDPRPRGRRRRRTPGGVRPRHAGRALPARRRLRADARDALGGGRRGRPRLGSADPPGAAREGRWRPRAKPSRG